MTGKLLDGKALSEVIRAEIALGVKQLIDAGGPRPGLAAVLVGNDPASQVYVRNKRRACEKAGMLSRLYELPEPTSQQELLDLVRTLNADPEIHGILVQLPLPRHMDENAILVAVDPRKDVDGFTPENQGLLVLGRPRFLSCTPSGIQQILLRNGIRVEGSNVVVVGRSSVVGKPMALILLQKAAGANATVTVCHSQSADIAAHTRQADIVIMAIGRAEFLKADMIRPGAVVIDVGINRLPDGRLVGDVEFAGVAARASAITPVPGGVGPMTITMLLDNTLRSARMAGGRATE